MHTPANLARPALLPGELILLALTACVAIAAILSSVLGGQAVDWQAFAPPMLGGMALILVGAYVRQRRGMERLALLLIGVSIYLTFGAFIAIFVFMFFPITGTPVDAALMRVDALIGYSWPDAVRAVAAVPYLGAALAFVYNSSLWQLLGVIAVLAMLRREVALHRFLLTGALALVATLSVWTIAPSFGPAAYHDLGPEIEAAVGLVVDAQYGALLMELAANGVAIITPETIVGSIAFPSYHTVMMCLVVWFCRRTPLFWPVLLFNLPMVPAILIHGGHHAFDMIGGFAIFVICLSLTQKVVNPLHHQPTFRHRSPV